MSSFPAGKFFSTIARCSAEKNVPPVSPSYLSKRKIYGANKLTALRDKRHIVPNLKHIGLVGHLVGLVKLTVSAKCNYLLEINTVVDGFVNVESLVMQRKLLLDLALFSFSLVKKAVSLSLWKRLRTKDHKI